MSINGIGRVGIRSSALPSIITNGLILNLDATDPASYPGTGTIWTDLSGGGHHATLVNGPTYNPANKGYIQFDGVNDYATGLGVRPTGAFTTSLWFKATNLSNYMFNLPTDPANIGTAMACNGPTRLTGYVFGAGGFGVMNNNSLTFNDNVFHNLVITLESNTMYATCIMYLDGVQVADGSIPGPYSFNASGQYNVATFTPTNNYASRVNVSQVLVYNKRLTPTEVMYNYTTFKSNKGY